MVKKPMKDIILVDEHDNPVGVTEKLHAHQTGALHRAFSVFIFNDDGEMLLQQRHPDKYHCGGLWTNACCSHPFPDEGILKAGERRLHEELGFTTKLSHKDTFIYRAEFDNGLIEHEFDHVLVGCYNGTIDKLNPEEISAIKWLMPDDVREQHQATPEAFTPWFMQAFEIATKP